MLDSDDNDNDILYMVRLGDGTTCIKKSDHYVVKLVGVILSSDSRKG